MILAAVLNAFFGLVNGILGLLPKGDPPSFIASVTPALRSAVESAGGLGGWVPWAIAASTAGAVFTVWLVLTTISGVRWLIGWIPTMGGS